MLRDSATGERLGKIEKFLLLHSIRPSASSPLIWYRLHARSCALQAYYRKSNGLSLRLERNVRQVIPLPEYRSLQVRFTNAMQRLAAKRYIEIYRVPAARLFGDRGRGPEPAEWRDGETYVKGVVATPINAHNCCRRYRVVYRLTTEGKDEGFAVIRSRRMERTRALRLKGDRVRIPTSSLFD